MATVLQAFLVLALEKIAAWPASISATSSTLAEDIHCPLAKTSVSWAGSASSRLRWLVGAGWIGSPDFKYFLLTERFTAQFRAEFFNILNHPNFNAPGFGGNGVVSVPNSLNFTNSNFGEIGSTRDAPYDPRQIQFALKLYF